MGATNPSGSYVRASFLSTPRFVAGVSELGIITLRVSHILSHLRPRIFDPSSFASSCCFACVLVSSSGTVMLPSSSRWFEFHLWSSKLHPVKSRWIVPCFVVLVGQSDLRILDRRHTSFFQLCNYFRSFFLPQIQVSF